MLDKSKIYYLSHPCTTYGKKEENIKDSKVIEILLRIRFGIRVINPIAIIIEGTTEEEAMKKCFHLYNACDEVIFCENWNKSTGCKEEHRWTQDDEKPHHFYDNGILKNMEE